MKIHVYTILSYVDEDQGGKQAKAKAKVDHTAKVRTTIKGVGAIQRQPGVAVKTRGLGDEIVGLEIGIK